MKLDQTVTPAGATAVVIPIPALPGAGGLEPKLQLSYSSQIGNSGFGLGWSLVGYATITRGSKTRDVDGAAGPVKFVNDDAFYLDAQRIVPVARHGAGQAPAWLAASQGAIEYRKFIDDGTVVYARLTSGGDIRDFVAESKSGLRTEFGLPVSGAPALKAPVAYLPTRTRDTAGNYINWTFAVDGLGYRLTQVDYTGLDGPRPVAPFASIILNYQPASRVLSRQLLGQEIKTPYWLKSVQSVLIGNTGAGQRGFKLELSYTPTAKADSYYLESAKLDAFGGAVAPSTFGYLANDKEKWVPIGDLDIPSLGGASSDLAYRLAVASGASGQPGPALFLSRFSNAQLQSKTIRPTISQWEDAPGAQAPPIAFVDSTGRSNHVAAIDLDGDGLTDLLQGDLQGKGVAWLQKHDAANPTADRWVRDVAHDDPGVAFSEADDSPRKITLQRFGGARKDLVIRERGGRYVVRRNNAGGWADPNLTFTVAPSVPVVFGDFDCDNIEDRAQLVSAGAAQTLEVYAVTAGGWVKKTSSAWTWSTSSSNSVAILPMRISLAACQSLLVAVRGATGAEALTVLEGAANGWETRAASSTSPILINANGARLHPTAVDLTSDGADDVLTYEIDSAGTTVRAGLRQVGRVMPTDPVEWESVPVFSPPIRLADKSGPFADVSVTAWTSGGAAIVAQPSSRNAKGQVYQLLPGGWQAFTDLAPAQPLNHGKADADPVRFIDLDGDGRQDIIFNDGAGQAGAELNTARGWIPASGWTPPRAIRKSGDMATRVILVDVNADGFTDLVYAYKSKDDGLVLQTHLNGKPFGQDKWLDPDPTWALPAAAVDTERGDLGWRLADIDADGRVDLVQSRVDRNFTVSGSAYINKGAGWDSRPGFRPSVAFVYDQGEGRTLDLGTQLIDFDGDRLPDLVAGYRNVARPSDTPTKGVFPNGGAAFATVASPEYTVPVMLDAPYFESASISFTDLDGDDNEDLIRFGANDAAVYLGTGRGWASTASSTWALPAAARHTTLGFGATRFVDVNGDGKRDVLYIRPGGDRGVYINTAAGWDALPTNSNFAPPDLPFLKENGDDAGVRLVDVTGHGAQDLIQSTKDKTGRRDSAVWRSPGARVGMLQAVVESSGIETSYAYARLVDEVATSPLVDRTARRAVFQRAASSAGAYPEIPLTPFSPVVVQSVAREGVGAGRSLTRQFSYADFRFDLRNAKALGFRRIVRAETTSDTDYALLRDTEYHQSGHLSGLPKIEATFVRRGFADVLVERTSKDWIIAQRDGATVGPAGARFDYLQLLLTGSVRTTRDLNGDPTGELVTEIDYDDWLNVKETRAIKLGRAAQVVTNAYVDPGGDPAYARYGRLTSSVAEVRDLTNGSVSGRRRSTFTYYPTIYLVQSQVEDLGDAQLNWTKTFGRNDRGDITATSHETAAARRDRQAARTAAFVPVIRTSQVTFDAQGRFLQTRTNGLGQTTTLIADDKSVDYALAQPSVEADPNGLRFERGLDVLGRSARLAGPDGVTRTITRIEIADIPSAWLSSLSLLKINPSLMRKAGRTKRAGAAVWSAPSVWYAEAQDIRSAGGQTRLERATIFDRRGRVVRRITPRTTGAATKLAFEDLRYDVRGRVLGETAPYFSGETAYWTTYEYDPLDRRWREERPNMGVATIAFAGLKQTRTDALGRKTEVTYTAEGKPAAIKRPTGGTVRIEYDLLERPIRMTTPNGVVTTYAYDAAGNRAAMDDPHLGPVEYRFDGFGQLREERAGTQAWAEFDYDLLGRPLRQWREDQVTAWSYDAPGAVGRPDKITLKRQNVPDALEYEEAYEHDSALRLRRTTTWVKALGTLDTDLATDFRGVYSFAYGPFGELSRATYPKSGPQAALVVERQYDLSTGQLTRVLDARTAAKPELWRLSVADASGRARAVRYGNSVRETRTYVPTTARLSDLQVFSSTGGKLLQTTYTHDLVGNLEERSTAGSPSQSFRFDEANRLTYYKRGSAKPIEVTYDEDDRITWKTKVGTYRYASDPNAQKYCLEANTRPGAVCAIETKGGTIVNQFEYDELGSLSARKNPDDEERGARIDYTSDRHVARITKLGKLGVPDNRHVAEFFYGPNGNRILSRQVGCKDDSLCLEHRSKEVLHLGLYERITVKRGSGAGSRLVTDRAYVAADAGVFLAIDAIDRSRATGNDATGVSKAYLYQHRDQLGSVVLLTPEDGKKGAKIEYDPWGKSRGALDADDDHDGDLGVEAAWTRGFTGHDHIPEFDLIHMTGRVYDPDLGMFLSVDPLASSGDSGGDLNPYLYASGNPLAYVDATGFGFGDFIRDVVRDVGNAIDRTVSDIGRGIEHLYKEAEQWVGQNWREIVTVAVIVVVTVATAGAAGPIVAAMAAGAAGAMTQSALYGGSVQDVLVAGFVGGVIGGISGGIGASGMSWYAQGLAQGFVSGVHSGMNGRSFESGFVIGFLSRVPSGAVFDNQSNWGAAGRVAQRAVINGTISEMQGGKFAMSALFGAGGAIWDEPSLGVRSYVQSFSWFAPGPADQFGFMDAVTIYGMISDQKLDHGVHFSATQGLPNDFMKRAQLHYDAWKGQAASVSAFATDPVKSDDGRSRREALELWRRPPRSGGNPRRRQGASGRSGRRHERLGRTVRRAA